MVRTAEQLKLMRKSGQITAKALKKAIEAVKVGVSLLEVEKAAAEEIKRNDAKLSFPTVEGYKWATCLTINEELVHGIPRDIKLKEGDILSIDVGALYKGWHTDAAWSVIVGGGKSPFLALGEEALWKAINEAKSGNRIGDISQQIQQTIEKAGYSVSKSLVGHGVGRELHEDPIVPGLGKAGTGMVLKENMTIAIEVIYASGNAEVYLSDDGWTYVTQDHSIGGLFEMSVIIGKEGPEVLTDWRKV